VRLEIETALAKKIPVIPALIDRSRMPKATDLPESLRPFAFRQAADIDSSRDFHAHMDRLIRSMDQLLPKSGVSSVAENTAAHASKPSAGQLAVLLKHLQPMAGSRTDAQPKDKVTIATASWADRLIPAIAALGLGVLFILLATSVEASHSSLSLLFMGVGAVGLVVGVVQAIRRT